MRHLLRSNLAQISVWSPAMEDSQKEESRRSNWRQRLSCSSALRNARGKFRKRSYGEVWCAQALKEGTPVKYGSWIVKLSEKQIGSMMTFVVIDRAILGDLWFASWRTTRVKSITWWASPAGEWGVRRHTSLACTQRLPVTLTGSGTSHQVVDAVL